MKKVLIIFMLFFLVGCSKNNEIKKPQKYESENKITENQFEDYIYLDVRTKDEYDESHLVGALNIPYDQIDENINLNKNAIIYVYCKSGKRSEIAYNKLRELGYNAQDLGAFDSINLPKE